MLYYQYIKTTEAAMYKILIVEDDITIAKTLKNHFIKWNYEADYVSDFKNITQQVASYEPHIILLDIVLPYFNGFYWCSEIRKLSKVPILFLSSASDEMNIVMAVNMGGDDFVAKPFDLNVLTAKVQALLRRTYSFQGQLNIIEHDGLILNLNDTTATYNNNKIELTKNDYKIIRILMENIGKVVSRDKIMEYLWESDSYIDDNTLTVNITRLRKKLDDAGVKDYIKTKKGIGYIVE